ncbi:ATP-dependent helicase HrpB [Brachybacterium saurashtrense]|uniref:ATP-dependent helicase HrpB n=1 Tax=Brachybacterium saurashtrense TaxID=556288 RepID=A0A345YSP6_9MICO|nr:ATP-dependent helicase HrpB [Brachybacterium saurashtrense]AXK46948.1 ATP-dependent helicase HrpB [Brachybacterium saurashtrense]RRR22663.1 ATP-dependent helicase HrpB [Brachybacterium saurashtrense]
MPGPTPAPRPVPHRFDLEAIGEGLPVAAARGELEAAARNGALVVTAPPGTGKTTLVPPLIANVAGGLTLVTQPRRVAVRAAARRLAALDGSAPGGPVGFTVRGQRRVGPGTAVEMLTPGVLLRRLLADPSLPGVAAVVLDEVHERSLETDLLLGMLAEARLLREDLTVGAMSATLDAAATVGVLGGAALVEVPSALHPLRIDLAPSPVPRLDARGVTRDYLDHLARTAARAQREEGCDALVFLPGAREVDETVVRLHGLVGAQVEVLPLHGRLPAAQQDRATGGRRPGEPPRIVVSTALAESSLTVPGVHLVVDAGLSREVRRDRGRDMSGLVTVSASRAAIEQRAGRAARQGPGRAVRVFSEAERAGMPAQSPPEITASDLTDAALWLACWGTPRGDGLPLLTAPPAAEIRAAEATLRALYLVDVEGRPTPAGRRVARLPVGVREARALREGARRLPGPDAAARAAEVVAAVSDDHRPAGADLPRLLADLRAGRAPGAERWRAERDRLARLAADDPAEGDPGEGPPAAIAARTNAEQAGAVLALARPERIARSTGAGERSVLLASGTRAALPEGSGLLGAQWLAVWEVQRAEGRAADGTGAVVRAAAPLTEADALALGAGLLREERTAALVDGTVRARRRRALGAIELTSTPVAATAEDAVPAVLSQVREQGLGALTWSEAARALRARLALLHRELGAPWPAVDEEALQDGLETWLAPQLSARTTRLDRIDLVAALRTLLPWPKAAELDALVPERLPVPSGSTARIDYPAPDDAAGRPVVAVKLQELFGLAETPRLVRGRVPVLFHLLSPARRPLAVTDDLRSFWDGPYREVRKEMRGRYPKHPWPEDPWTAPATARTTRRAGR